MAKIAEYQGYRAVLMHPKECYWLRHLWKEAKDDRTVLALDRQDVVRDSANGEQPVWLPMVISCKDENVNHVTLFDKQGWPVEGNSASKPVAQALLQFARVLLASDDSFLTAEAQK